MLCWKLEALRMKTVGRCAVAVLLLMLHAGAVSAAPKLVGLNVHQSRDVGLPVATKCKAGIVRIDFNWFQIETSQGSYDFSLFDQLIDDAVARDLTVLATVGYTPAWASSANTDGEDTLNDVPNAGLYELFVAEAVARYSDRVKHWELWNEPNLGDFFEGGVSDCVGLILRPGAAAVHAHCADCQVLGPDVATIGDDYDAWMQAAFEQAGDDIDIVSAHVYSGFTDLGAASTDATFFSKLEDHRILKIGETVVHEDPLSIRECMTKYGMGSKPFWMTETGKRAAYSDTEATADQAAYVRHVMEAMLTRSWWDATVFYEAFDVPGEDYLWGFALQDTSAPDGFLEKPVCGVMRKAVEQQPAMGGTGTDCTDGLDNEGDGTIDYPGDEDCESAKSTSEGMPPADAGVDANLPDAGDEGGTGASSSPSEGDSGCSCRAGGTGDSAEWVAVAALFAAVRRKARERGSSKQSNTPK